MGGSRKSRRRRAACPRVIVSPPMLILIAVTFFLAGIVKGVTGMGLPTAASAFAVVPALLGMQLGQMIRHRISPATFRRWCLILLGALGVEITMRPLF